MTPQDGAPTTWVCQQCHSPQGFSADGKCFACEGPLAKSPAPGAPDIPALIERLRAEADKCAWQTVTDLLREAADTLDTLTTLTTLTAERTCPCGFDNEPWHYPRNGMCSIGANMRVKKGG
jgi:hypothetical protein